MSTTLTSGFTSHVRELPWEWKIIVFLTFLLLLLLQRWVFTTHKNHHHHLMAWRRWEIFSSHFLAQLSSSLAFAALSIELHVQYFKIDLKIPFSENSSALYFSLADCSIFFRSRTIFFPFSRSLLRCWICLLTPRRVLSIIFSLLCNARFCVCVCVCQIVDGFSWGWVRTETSS